MIDDETREPQSSHILAIDAIIFITPKFAEQVRFYKDILRCKILAEEEGLVFFAMGKQNSRPVHAGTGSRRRPKAW